MTDAPIAGTVHVVEDDTVLADALCLLLMSRGLSTVAYPSGEAFLARVDAAWPGGPACVLMDVRMKSSPASRPSTGCARAGPRFRRRSSSSPATATSRWRSTR